MDKNKFWLGGRLFNTASRHVRNARHVRKLGGPTHVCNANARHVRRLGSPTHVRNANARHVCNARHVRTSASWPPQRNARNIRKMGTQTKNSSATKTSTQGSTRIKDEMEDG